MEFIKQNKIIFIGTAVVVLGSLLLWWFFRDNMEVAPLPFPEEKVDPPSKPTLAMFYSTGCPPSIAALAAFRAAAAELEKSGVFATAEITVEDNPDAIAAHNIKAFPTFRLYQGEITPPSQGTQHKEYPSTGNRSVESFLNFVYSEGNKA